MTAPTIAFAISFPLSRADLADLCESMCASRETSGAEIVLCDVSGVEPDAPTVDALARLQLGARRHGCRVQLRGASRELRELIAFMGLCDVLPS